MENLNKNTLIVDATDGVTSDTQEQIRLSLQKGVSEIDVVLTKTDLVDDDDMLDLIETEIRELLSSQGYDGDNAAITRA